MLKLSISTQQPATGWTWDAGQYRNASSWVSPLNHPSLETVAATDGAASTFICIRERASRAVAQPEVQLLETQSFARRKSEISGWPLDYLLISLDATQVAISSGAWGTAPIYLTADANVLSGSWDIADLVGNHSSRQLLDREVARILTLRHRYSSDTLYPDIHLLTERSTATVSRCGIRIHYPEPARHALPRALKSDTAVLPFYEEMLAGSVRARHYEPNDLVIELSGGLDSTNVAMTLQKLHPTRLRSYALMISGEPGAQQHRRRQFVIDRCGFDDQQVALRHILPFTLRERGNQTALGPYDDPYVGAFTELVNMARRRGARVAMTGIGGDELVAPYATEAEIPETVRAARLALPPWLGRRTLEAYKDADDGIAPGAVLAESSLLASACRAPAFLRAGIWPVSPFCDPQLIRFAESLPYDWRRDKALHRRRLASLGFSAEWINPALSETFTDDMNTAIEKAGPRLIDQLLRSSALADSGYIDPKKVASVFRDGGWRHGRIPSMLYAVLRLEEVLTAR